VNIFLADNAIMGLSVQRIRRAMPLSPLLTTNAVVSKVCILIFVD
jgi:hypothetical protein